MVVANNIPALNAQRQFNMVLGQRAKSMEKLSSGYKINRAADDAAGLSISEKMRKQIRGLTRAAQNVQDGISFAQIADGALTEVHDMLGRMSELAIQSANGTNSDSDRKAIDDEVQMLKSEVNRIFKTTSFNDHYIWRAPYIPDVRRNPSSEIDFQTYNVNGTETGGIAVDNVRYSWNELGLTSKIDNGIFNDDGEIKKTLSNGELLHLKYKEGDSVDKLTRIYHWKADEEGITINDNSSAKASWASMGISSSRALGGTYSFIYKGSTIEFDVEPGDSFEDVIAGINGDDISEVYWQTQNTGALTHTGVNIQSFNLPPITPSNQNAILSPNWVFKADDEGFKLTINGNDDTSVQWSNFTNINGKNPMADFGTPSETTNATTLDDDTPYRYTSGQSGSSLTLYVKDEISKEVLIKGLNDMTVEKSFSAYMQESYIASQDGFDITLKERGLSFGMQNYLGRDFSQTDAFQTTSSWDGSTLSLTFSGSKKSVTYEVALSEGKFKDYAQKGFKEGLVLKAQNRGDLLASISDAEKTENLKTVDDTITIYLDFRSMFNSAKTARDALESTRQSNISSQKNTAKDAITSAATSAGLSITDSQSYSVSDSLTNTYISKKDAGYTDDALKTDISTALSAQGITKGVLTDDVWNSFIDQVASTIKTSGDTIISANQTYTTSVENLAANNLSSATSTLKNINSTINAYKANVDTLKLNTNPNTSREVTFDYKVIAPKKKINIQAGADPDNKITMEWSPLTLGILSMSGLLVDHEECATNAIKTIDNARAIISNQRSYFGAMQNRFEHTYDNLNNVVENTTAAESRIRDTDMAEEMCRMTIQNMLIQAGQMIMAQANQQPQGALALLQ